MRPTRGDDIAVGVAGRCDERLSGSDGDPSVLLGFLAGGDPEVATRAELAPRQGAEVRAAGGEAKLPFSFLRDGTIGRYAAEMHQVDHGARRAPLGEFIQYGARHPGALSDASVLRGNGEAEEASLPQGVDRLPGEGPIRVHLLGFRGDHALGDFFGFVYDRLLLRAQTIHGSPSSSLSLDNHP